jgi:hypothetical protein
MGILQQGGTDDVQWLEQSCLARDTFLNCVDFNHLVLFCSSVLLRPGYATAMASSQQCSWLFEHVSVMPWVRSVVA